MTQPAKLIFLPGAGGSAQFWQPVNARLHHPAARMLLGWPGLGGNPPDARVNGIEDLVELVLAQMDEPCALIAQSMGGVIAVKAAMRRPQLVTHLVLAATSGGIDVSGLRTEDWRPAFFASHPHAPRWFAEWQGNLGREFEQLQMPVLLLWGDADPISPVAMGRRLAELLPCSRMHVLPGGAHDLANTHADRVAPLIELHLMC